MDPEKRLSSEELLRHSFLLEKDANLDTSFVELRSNEEQALISDLPLLKKVGIIIFKISLLQYKWVSQITITFCFI